MTTANATKLAAVSNSQFYATYSSGTWEYNGGWSQLSTAVASQLGNDGSTMIGGYSSGTYTFDGSWHKISRRHSPSWWVDGGDLQESTTRPG